jgi:peptidoglycan L-alanyl-D-glutamate endopeptidase CwlK
MASREINDLLEPVRRRALEHGRLCEAAFYGTPISSAIVCTWRDPREQDCLYLQGRGNLLTVNVKRALIGLPAIAAAENKIRTNAIPGQSLHEYRCAYDMLAFENGKLIASGDHPAYQRIGELGKSVGLEWSGRWKGKIREAAHFQYLGGLTMDELREGKRPI